MGMVPEDHGANLTEWVTEIRPDGEEAFSKDVRGLAHVFPYPWQLMHRVDLHNQLKDLAISTSGSGTPVILHLQCRVVSVDSGAASLQLADGTTHSGDFIIAADGIHSKIRSLLVKNRALPEPSGSSAFRFLIPVDVIRSDPKTAHLVERTGEMKILHGIERRLVQYPCRKNTIINFVAMHPDEETEASGEEWSQAASREKMLECFSRYPEDVKAMIAKVDPDGLSLWKLLDHEELGKENWVHGNIVLLGDAAHGFLPHLGQGGAQAIEDGAAIGALFPLGTLPSDIPERFELYVQARYDRATMVQDHTRQSAFKTKRGKHGGKAMDPMQFTEVNFNHDAFDHAQGILLRDMSKKAVYRRMPLSFGPVPGPRQNLNGIPRAIGKMSYKTSYITFKTHKSYISNLLPTEDFSIVPRGPPSWATATFAISTLGQLDWLGGRGYSFFGLFIHDVTHAAKGGKETRENKTRGRLCASAVREHGRSNHHRQGRAGVCKGVCIPRGCIVSPIILCSKCWVGRYRVLPHVS